MTAKAKFEIESDSSDAEKDLLKLSQEFDEMRESISKLTGQPVTKYFTDMERAIGEVARSAKKMETLDAAKRAFERMTPAEREAAIAALNFAEAQEKAAQKTRDMEQASKGNAFTELKSKIDLAFAALERFGRSVKQVYDFGRAGAEIDYARTKFDRLAQTVGTTADVMLKDLRDATRGTLSDAELMAGAGDLMALGLANSHDQVVRLSKVVGGLGMDMNQLVLTLTNQTTMRFDALGVSVDGFDEKVNELKRSGMDASEAFKEAFLQQAEEQLTKVGNKADESIGSFMKFEASLKNLGDEIKKNTTPEIEKLVAALNTQFASLERLQRAVDEGKRVQVGANGAIKIAERAYGELADAERYAALAADYMKDANTELKPSVDDTTSSVERYTRQAWIAAEGTAAVDEAARDSAEGMRELKTAQDEFNGAIEAFNSKQAGNVVSKLEAAGLKGEDLTRALQGVDSVMGTNYATERLLNQELDKIIENYKNTKDVDTFTEALEANRTKWALVDEAIGNAHTKFNNFISSVAGADGLQIEIMVNAVKAWGSGGGGGGSGNSNGYTGNGDGPGVWGYDDYGASGLSRIVPPGYDETAGRPFTVGASSGERVTITPDGSDPARSSSGYSVYIAKGAIVINGAGGNADAIANAVLAKIGQKTRAGRLAGYGYAGG
jgi:hypothetical protein